MGDEQSLKGGLMVKRRTPYWKMPGRWTPIHIVLIVLGIPLAAVVTSLLSLHRTHAFIAVYFAWIALILWADVWMFRSQQRTMLFVRVAATWTVLTALVAVLVLVIL